MEAELEHACALLALHEDPQVRRKITDLMLAVLKDTKTLPPAEEVRRKVRTHQDLNPTVTVTEWMTEFLRRKRKIDATPRHSYEAHIRLYFTPYLGDIRLDRLRVSDIAGMFDAIEEFNDVITTARASDDPDKRAKVRYRRPVGPSTMHRIRATLRHALNMAIKQDRLIDFNPAAVVELPDADKPKALVWTDERVAAWNQDLHQRLEPHGRSNASEQLSSSHRPAICVREPGSLAVISNAMLGLLDVHGYARAGAHHVGRLPSVASRRPIGLRLHRDRPP
ncbi:hypothetical protein ABZ912_59050 [Nonomuraea angiospora]|uniref:hypothetical protein n=1 Tax=Nonomuraea angiospora TaxID=46172 RepID=UPI0033CD63F7